MTGQPSLVVLLEATCKEQSAKAALACSLPELPTLVVPIGGHHTKTGIGSCADNAWSLVCGCSRREQQQWSPDGQQQQAEQQRALQQNNTVRQHSMAHCMKSKVPAECPIFSASNTPALGCYIHSGLGTLKHTVCCCRCRRPCTGDPSSLYTCAQFAHLQELHVAWHTLTNRPLCTVSSPARHNRSDNTCSF